MNPEDAQNPEEVKPEYWDPIEEASPSIEVLTGMVNDLARRLHADGYQSAAEAVVKRAQDALVEVRATIHRSWHEQSPGVIWPSGLD